MAANQPGKTEDISLEERAAFLSGPPRSGELSPFAQKLAAQIFIWLCSLVVFGSTLEFSSDDDKECSKLCKFHIVTGLISFLFSSSLLISHYLTWSNKVEKTAWFSGKAELRSMVCLTVLWICGAAALSAIEKCDKDCDTGPDPELQEHARGLAIIFGWLALFACVFGSYKTYHTSKEDQKSLRYAQVMSMQAAEEEEYANF